MRKNIIHKGAEVSFTLNQTYVLVHDTDYQIDWELQKIYLNGLSFDSKKIHLDEIRTGQIITAIVGGFLGLRSEITFFDCKLITWGKERYVGEFIILQNVIFSYKEVKVKNEDLKKIVVKSPY